MAAAQPGTHGRLIVPVLVLLLAGSHMLLFDRGMGGDGWATFALTESLLEDGDVDVENNLRGVRNGLLTHAGRTVVQYPPGAVVLDLVPAAFGRAADALLPVWLLGAELELPPVGVVPRRTFLAVACIVLFRNLAALAGLALVALALEELGVARRLAWPASLAAVIGGPLVFYSLVGMTHAPVFALAALLMLLLVRRRSERGIRGWLIIGAVCGAAILIRYDAVVLLVVASVAAGARPRRWAALGAGALPVLAMLPLWWRLHHGSWMPAGYGGELELSLLAPLRLLLAPTHGALFFHPVLLLGIAGLVLAAGPGSPRRSPAALALLWVAMTATLHGGWSEWSNAGGWGQRFLIDATPAFALGIATLLERGRAAVLAAVACCMFTWALFFFAVSGIAPPPPGQPWPQTLADYAPVVHHPPGLARLRIGLERASYLF